MFPAFFKLPDEIQKLVSAEDLLVCLALLGITLSMAWFILINSNLRQSIIKYEGVKELENKLNCRFFQYEWELLEKYRRGKTYWGTPYIEMFVPVLFFIIFTLLLHLVSGIFPDKPYDKLTYYPGFLIGVFSFDGIRSWQIDREIRGLKRWSNNTVSCVSLIVPLVITLGGLLLFRYMGCGGVVDKDVKTVNEKSVKTSSKKDAKKQIVPPDEEETESVDEEPTADVSENPTKGQDDVLEDALKNALEGSENTTKEQNGDQ